MPDAQGNYLGDSANVLPDNTQAMLHFSTIFAQQEAKRQAQKKADADAESNRLNKHRDNFDKQLDAKDMLPDMEEDVTNGHKQIADLINSGVKDDKLIPAAYKIVNGIKFKNEALKAGDANIAANLVGKSKDDTTLDAASLGTQAKIYSRKKLDPKTGQWVKKTGDELKADLNNGTDFVKQAYDENPSAYHFTNAYSNVLENKIDKGASVFKDAPVYDPKTGKQTSPGAEVKLNENLMNVEKDKDGKVVYKDGKPIISVKQDYYTPEGQSTPIVDAQGQKMPVLSKSAYDNFFLGNPSALAELDKRVKDQLSHPANFNGQEQIFSPQSEYAKMLTGNTALKMMQERTDGKYAVTTPENKQIEEMRKIHSENVQDQHLNIENQRLTLAKHADSRAANKEEIAQAAADNKEVTAGNLTSIPKLWDAKAGQNTTATITSTDPNNKKTTETKNIRYIPESVIDAKDNAVLQASITPKGSKTKIPRTDAASINVDGKQVKGYYVIKGKNADGSISTDLQGAGGKIIREGRVLDDQLEALKSGDLPKSSLYQKGVASVKKALGITPKADKIKGTDKKMF